MHCSLPPARVHGVHSLPPPCQPPHSPAHTSRSALHPHAATLDLAPHPPASLPPKVTEGHPLSSLSFYLIHSEGLISQFDLHPSKLARWVR